MGLTIGPSDWWYSSIARACPVGTTLLDGSRIFCKASGTAWIVAPAATQVISQWADGKYNGIDAPGTEVCCISEWTTVCTALINNGFNPCNWFVPNISQLQSGYNCRFFWDSFSDSNQYWSSTELNVSNGCRLISGGPSYVDKSCSSLGNMSVRAMRCVTY